MYVLYFQADEAPATQTGPVATPSADPVESAVPEEDEIVGESQGGDQAKEDPVNPDVIEISDSSQPLTTEGATAAADIVNQGEQVGKGPQGPSGGLAPEVVAACTRAHLVDLGVAPPTSGHPPVADPAPFSFSSPRPLLQGGPRACPWSSGGPFLPLLEGARPGLPGLVMGPSRGGQFTPPLPQPLLLLHPPCPLEGQPRGRPHPVGSLYHPGSGRRPGGSLFGTPPRIS